MVSNLYLRPCVPAALLLFDCVLCGHGVRQAVGQTAGSISSSGSDSPPLLRNYSCLSLGVSGCSIELHEWRFGVIFLVRWIAAVVSVNLAKH